MGMTKEDKKQLEWSNKNIHRHKGFNMIGTVETSDNDMTINLIGPIRTPVDIRVIDMVGPIGALDGL